MTIQALLKDEQVQSITFDNGKEFALHEHIEQGLNTDIYFAKPYHSWERGTNENINGLIRRFPPKSIMPIILMRNKLSKLSLI